MKKKILSFVLCVVMLVTLLPMSAFATVGEITPQGPEDTGTLMFRMSGPNRDTSYDPYNGYPDGLYTILYNNYITLVLWPDGSSTTRPTSELKGLIQTVNISDGNLVIDNKMMSMDTLRDLGLVRTERIDFSWDFSDWALEQDFYGNKNEFIKNSRNYDRYLPREKHENVPSFYITVNEPDTIDIDGKTELRLSAKYVEGDWNATLSYRLVELGFDEYDYWCENNWGVRVDAEINDTWWDWEALKDDSDRDEERYIKQKEQYSGYPIVMLTDHFDVTTLNNGGQFDNLTVTTAPSKSGYALGYITDLDKPYSVVDDMRGVYTAIYRVATSEGINRKVIALSNVYMDGGGVNSEGVPGHALNTFYPVGGGDYSSYGNFYALSSQSQVNDNSTSNTVHVYSVATFLSPDKDIKERIPTYTSGLWGFDNMEYTDINLENPFHNDNFELPDSNNILGIIMDGDGLIAQSAETADDLTRNYSDKVVAIFRGDYDFKDDTNQYEFTAGKVALSANVTASWEEDGYFRVDKKGKVTSRGITLSCPAFDFYKPLDVFKNDEQALDFFGEVYDDDAHKWVPSYSSGKFRIGFKKSTNAAIVHIDIPGFTTYLDGATIRTDGVVDFDGMLDLSVPFLEEVAGIDVTRLSLGDKERLITGNPAYGVTRITAGGHASIPSFFGLGATGGDDKGGGKDDNKGEDGEGVALNASVDIDWAFRDKESKFDFSFNVKIPQLFELALALGLKQIDSGWILPDSGYFQAAIPNLPLDITPITPVIGLRGFEGSINNLADSLNITADYFRGKFDGLPPLRIMFGANIALAKVVTGWVNGTLGIPYIKLTVHDPAVADKDIGHSEFWDEAEAIFRGEEYGGKNYYGVELKNSVGAEFAFPSSDNNIISVSSAIDFDGFTGLNFKGYLPDGVYGYIEGGSWAKGEVRVPNMTIIPKPLKGMKVGDADIYTSIKGSLLAHFDAQKTVQENIQELWKNLALDLNFQHDGEILFVGYWVRANAHVQKDKSKAFVGIGYDGLFFGPEITFDFGKDANSTSYVATKGLKSNLEEVAVEDLEDLYDIQFFMPKPLLLGEGIDREAIRIDNSDPKNQTITIDGSKLDGVDVLHFNLIPNESLKEDELRKMFAISGSVHSAYQMIDAFDKDGNVAENGNFYIDEDENGKLYMKVFLPKPDSGTEVWTITGTNSKDFTIDVEGYKDPARIAGVDNNGTITLEGLEKDKEYELALYFVDDEGGYRSVDIDSSDNTAEPIAGSAIRTSTSFIIKDEEGTKTYNFNIPNNLYSLPTGDYKLSYRLGERRIEDGEEVILQLDEFGNTDDEIIPVSNVNPDDVNKPAAPTNVKLTTGGNESLVASWDAGDSTIDGYSVEIYQNVNGEWIDTGAGYQILRDENGSLPDKAEMSLANTSKDGVRLAPTKEGEPGTFVEDPTSVILKTDQNYKVGVRALRRDTQADAFDMNYSDGSDIILYKESDEVISSQVKLNKANYPEIEHSTSVSAENATSPKAIFPAEQDFVETVYVEPGKTKINFESDQNVSWNARYMGRNEDGEIEEITIDWDKSGMQRFNSFKVPEFYGSLIVLVEAANSNGDTTTTAIQLRYDDVAPVVTMNRDVFRINDDGTFTISGITESGAKVEILSIDDLDSGLRSSVKGAAKEITGESDDSEPVFLSNVKGSVKQESDGNFSITGKLPKHQAKKGGSIVVAVTDECGNREVTVVKLDRIKHVYRLHNSKNGDHLFTTSEEERNNAENGGWNYEGVAFLAPDEGKKVYRLFNKKTERHIYTTSVKEKNALVARGWILEEESFVSSGDKEVYRLFSPTGKHLFTTNERERDILVKRGWTYEGTGFKAKSDVK